MVENVTLRSDALCGNVTLTVVSPSKKQAKRVLIFLHGSMQPEEFFPLIETMPQELLLEELCDRYELVTVIPLMKNHYYISSEDYDCDRFISEELPEWIAARYPLPANPEFVLGGISMGGYGAVLIGAHTDRFQRIISVSGAFITDDIEIGNPEIWGNMLPTAQSTRNSWLYWFLPLAELHESTAKNVYAALESLEEKADRMHILVACGTADSMMSRNERFVNKLRQLKISHEYMWIQDGRHDDSCFREGLWWAVKMLF